MTAIAVLPFLVIEHTAGSEQANPVEPSFMPPEGYYDHDVLLRIEAFGYQALYTTDGSIPTFKNGTLYARPILLDASSAKLVVVRARLVLLDGRCGLGDDCQIEGVMGPVVSGSFWLGAEPPLPVLSLVVDPDDLYDPETGLLTFPLEKGREWERSVEITFFDHGQAAFHIPAGIRVHGHGSRVYEKLSYRLYFRREYGANRLEYPIFDREISSLQNQASGAGDISFKRLVLHAGGQDFPTPERGHNWTLLRNQLVPALAEQTNNYTIQTRPALVFMNGEPGGVYQIRNFVDEWFFADNYNIESIDIIDTHDLDAELGLDPDTLESKIVAGWDSEKIKAWFDWEWLLNFVNTHDLNDAANYAYLETQVDMPNLIDYLFLELYVANKDWPQNNQRQFRSKTQGGKWRWFIWDVDFSFGLSPWGDYDTDMIDWLYSTDEWNLDQASLLFRKLLETERFRSLFLARSADLLNTVLAPDKVVKQIDELAAEIRPAIRYEEALWSSSGDWETSVGYLKEFARRRPDILRSQFLSHFGLPGTARIELNPPTGGEGYLAVNGMLLPAESWGGEYFQGIPITITAAPAKGFCFVGWQEDGLPGEPEISIFVRGDRSITPIFTRLESDECKTQGYLNGWQPGDVAIRNVAIDRDDGSSDLVELVVQRPGGVDLRGWRLTDNDSKSGTAEGSLIFSDRKVLADVPNGTIVQVAANSSMTARALPQDDLDPRDGRLVLYVGNGGITPARDSWFDLENGDNLALLEPGPTAAYDDDGGIAFASLGNHRQPAVTPATFGIFSDGVTTGMPLVSPKMP